MRKPSVFMVAMALLLLPAQALAGVCLRNQFGHHIFITRVLEADGMANLVGAWLFGGAPCDTAPLVGNWWLDTEGNAHIGLTINGPNAAGCSPYSVEGTLDAASGFTTGSGFFQNLTVPADKGPLTFTRGAPGSCPSPLP